MRTILVGMLVLIASAGTLTGQPQHGDLIVGYQRGYAQGGPGLLYVSPSSTGSWATLCTYRDPSAQQSQLIRIHMSETNAEILVPITNRGNVILKIDPRTGAITTLVHTPTNFADLDLDFDDTWVLCGIDIPSPWSNVVYSLHFPTMTFTTLWSQPGSVMNQYHAVSIDRDPNALGPYVLTRLQTDLQFADRTGILTSLAAPSRRLTFATTDPQSGRYLLLNWDGVGGSMQWVQKNGSNPSTFKTGGDAIAAAIAQDGTIWVVSLAGRNTTTLHVQHVSRSGKVLKTIPLNGLSTSANPWGLEIFGSRPLVCSLPSTSNRVTVRVQSQHPMVVPNQTQYALAASFARRPGVRMPNNEWLNLNVVSDPLFYASVFNSLPTIFKNFQGVVGNNGIATATVDIPPPLRNSGDTIFVAGILMNQGQVFEVTKTHWFVL